MSRPKDATQRQESQTHLFVVTLRCGHQVVFRTPAPKTGQVIACRTCKWQMRTVVDSVGEFAARCKKGKCRYYFHGGADESAACRDAKSHMRSYPGHQAVLMQGMKEVRKIINDLPVPGSARWHREHPEHSGMLRDFAERTGS